MFVPALIRIPVTDQYLFSTTVIPRPLLNDQLLHTQISETVRNEETQRTRLFSEVKHRHGNAVPSLQYI